MASGCLRHIAIRKALANIAVITDKLGRLISWLRSKSGNELAYEEEPPLRSEHDNGVGPSRRATVRQGSAGPVKGLPEGKTPPAAEVSTHYEGDRPHGVRRHAR